MVLRRLKRTQVVERQRCRFQIAFESGQGGGLRCGGLGARARRQCHKGEKPPDQKQTSFFSEMRHASRALVRGNMENRRCRGGRTFCKSAGETAPSAVQSVLTHYAILFTASAALEEAFEERGSTGGSFPIPRTLAWFPFTPVPFLPIQTLIDYLRSGETLDRFLEGVPIAKRPTVERKQAEAYLEMTLKDAETHA